MVAATNKDVRIERDVLGALEVPADAYWGINTQRALLNFQISGRRVPHQFILAVAKVKKACAQANLELGLLPAHLAEAILRALDELLVEGKYADQFPIDAFQTGSGTQTNMNVNEVVANRAAELLGAPKGRKDPVHPNDHVNLSQSSNDVIPTAAHVAALDVLREELFPALEELGVSLAKAMDRFTGVVKVGRTHLQDAVPVPMSMEFGVFAEQVSCARARLQSCYAELLEVPLGGTAVGTGLNAPTGFAELATSKLASLTGHALRPSRLKAAGIATHHALVHASAALRGLALSLLKMANDIRWMGSGPRAGLCELRLPQNEPGSSIMPGKVNPTQAEALIQVCLQVVGNDAVVAAGEAHGSVLDLNVCKPIMTFALLDSIHLLARGTRSFVKHCLDGLEPNLPSIRAQLEGLLMVATNLVPVLGYDKAAEVAKRAERENKTVRQVVVEEGLLQEEELDELLNPERMI
ncbi:MAG: class II fumarate hydratase [Promethearchaeota archaeon]